MRDKPRPLLAALSAALLVLLSHAAPVRAEGEGWVGARTRHFQVYGQTGEAEARGAALRLELFRAALARVLPREHFQPTAGATVLLFRDNATYAPFKPLQHGRAAADVAGYFQPGPEIDYITVASDGELSRTLPHEYVHLLVNNFYPRAPLWLKEGLAEFYSTASLSADGRQLTLGTPLLRRAREMRGRPLLPLAVLLSAENDSPHYVEPGKRALFYAQSWALVHQLAGEGAAGRARVTRYLELLSAGEPSAEAFAQAFGATVAEAERAHAAYVRRAEYRERVETFETPVELQVGVEVRGLTRAEALAQLGGLLLGTERAEEAEDYLLRAVGLDGGLAAAKHWLGVQRLRQGRFAEARALLQKALDADPQNHLARFHLADALHREGLGMGEDDMTVSGFEEKTRVLREELRRAIEGAPDFVEPYRLLATVELDRAGRTDAAAALLGEAISRAPRRRELTLLLAQVRLSAGEFEAARTLAGPLARGGDPFLREQAQKLLAQVEARAERAARLREQDEEAARLEAATSIPALPCDMPEPGPQQKRLRFAGEQACGRLVEIECGEGDGVTLHVEAEGRLLRLRAEAINRVRFVTYTPAVKAASRITCGPRDTDNLVLVTFRPRRADPSGLDGDASAVEFIK